MNFDNFFINTKPNIEKYKNIYNTLNTSPYLLLDTINVFSPKYNNLICFTLMDSGGKTKALLLTNLSPIIIGGNKTIFFDSITPYGYSGPVYSDDIKPFELIEFWKYIDEWYLENNVVTEFIRFDLSDILYYSGEIVPTMLNIKVKIVSEESQWDCFDRKVRKNINKAKREGLKYIFHNSNISSGEIEEFFNIYISTMERTNAKKIFFYEFSDIYNYITNNKDRCGVGTIYFENIPIASELVLFSKQTMYSFLGGTNEFYFEKRPNDFLKFELINTARNKGISHFILGGGYGKEDGIFNYKKSFFPDGVITFQTGRKIIDNIAYNKLINMSNNYRLNNNLDSLDLSDQTFFPQYNK